MSKIFSLLKYAVPVLAALGVGFLADKYAADKIPGYPVEGLTAGTSSKKIMWLAGAAVIGGILVKFISSKLRIKIF